MKSNYEAEHERNIDNMIQDDDYKSPWKNKDATVATTVNNALDDTGYTLDETGYTYLNSYDTSDSSKQVEKSKEPIKYTRTIKEPIKGPHVVNIVRYLMDGPTNMDPVLTGVGIIGQGGPRTISGGSIPKALFKGEKV